MQTCSSSESASADRGLVITNCRNLQSSFGLMSHYVSLRYDLVSVCVSRTAVQRCENLVEKYNQGRIDHLPVEEMLVSRTSLACSYSLFRTFLLLTLKGDLFRGFPEREYFSFKFPVLNMLTKFLVFKKSIPLQLTPGPGHISLRKDA